MKKISASILPALFMFPIVACACGGGDCSMDLPAPEVPAPGTVEQTVNALSAHSGLFAAMAIIAIGGIVFSRQRRLLATKSVAQSFAEGAT